MSAFEAPIPLSDIETVLAWVDTFKLSRPTKKINRDFSDAVLLAEILNVYYPKLVEMHNYPPRNSHALKLNNWMTLNRKVLRKLKLNLCCSTMEQLANCAPGVIERVLIMVREKIRRDEELNKSKEDQEQVSSGGCYYDACGDDEHVLVVSLKSRVNGVLETIQQKVVSHELYLTAKQEIKDLQDCNDVLKNKVEHLDNLLKLKDERIEELQKQLERKQTRRKEVEALQNSLSIPFDSAPPTPKIPDSANLLSKSASMKFNESISRIPVFEDKAKDEIILMKSDDPIVKSLISVTSKPSNEIMLIKPEDPVTKSLISATSKPSNEIKLAKSEDTVSKSLISATSKPSNEIKLAKSEDTVSKSLVSATSKPSNEIKLIKSEDAIPKSVVSVSSKPTVKPCESISKIPKLEDFYLRDVSKISKGDKELKGSEERILKIESIEKFDVKESKQSLTGPKSSEVIHIGAIVHDVDRDDSKIFQEYEIHEEKSEEYIDEFKDSVEDVMVTIEDSIKKEVKEIFNPLEFANQNFI